MDRGDLDWLLRTLGAMRDELSALADTDLSWLECVTPGCDGQLDAFLPETLRTSRRVLMICDTCGKPQAFGAAVLDVVDWDDLERTMKRIAHDEGAVWPPR